MILAFLLLQHVLASISIPPFSGVVLVPQVSLPLLGIYLLWAPLMLLLLLLRLRLLLLRLRLLL